MLGHVGVEDRGGHQAPIRLRVTSRSRLPAFSAFSLPSTSAASPADPRNVTGSGPPRAGSRSRSARRVVRSARARSSCRSRRALRRRRRRHRARSPRSGRPRRRRGPSRPPPRWASHCSCVVLPRESSPSAPSTCSSSVPGRALDVTVSDNRPPLLDVPLVLPPHQPSQRGHPPYDRGRRWHKRPGTRSGALPGVVRPGWQGRDHERRAVSAVRGPDRCPQLRDGRERPRQPRRLPPVRRARPDGALPGRRVVPARARRTRPDDRAAVDDGALPGRAARRRRAADRLGDRVHGAQAVHDESPDRPGGRGRRGPDGRSRGRGGVHPRGPRHHDATAGRRSPRQARRRVVGPGPAGAGSGRHHVLARAVAAGRRHGPRAAQPRPAGPAPYGPPDPVRGGRPGPRRPDQRRHRSAGPPHRAARPEVGPRAVQQTPVACLVGVGGHRHAGACLAVGDVAQPGDRRREAAQRDRPALRRQRHLGQEAAQPDGVALHLLAQRRLVGSVVVPQVGARGVAEDVAGQDHADEELAVLAAVGGGARAHGLVEAADGAGGPGAHGEVGADAEQAGGEGEDRGVRGGLGEGEPAWGEALVPGQGDVGGAFLGAAQAGGQYRAGDAGELGVRGEGAGDARGPGGVDLGVVVGEGDDLGAGLGQTPVAPDRRAPAGLADVADPRGPGGGDGVAGELVRRVVVDDDDRQRRVVGGEDRAQAAGQRLRPVAGRDHHRHGVARDRSRGHPLGRPQGDQCGPQLRDRGATATQRHGHLTLRSATDGDEQTGGVEGRVDPQITQRAEPVQLTDPGRGVVRRRHP
ncbi:hypothetical protein L7F22_015013 [Adiantum nelumboides]|nr:hypothetical protein [Adiantum nelumboides]